MTVAVLGPGGVGGLVAGALERAGEQVLVLARAPTAALIAERGLRVSSVRLGDFVAHPRALVRAGGAGGRVGRGHQGRGTAAGARARRGGAAVGAAAAQRPRPPGVAARALRRAGGGGGHDSRRGRTARVGVVVHTSPFLRIDMASRYAAARPAMEALAAQLEAAGIPARVRDSEPQVLWSKLVRLNALACTTSAHDKLLGEIRDTPALRAELVGAIEEGCAAANAEGASIDASDPLGELNDAHATLGSSMQRDIAAGRTAGAGRDRGGGAARGGAPWVGVPNDRGTGREDRGARGRAGAACRALSR